MKWYQVIQSIHFSGTPRFKKAGFIYYAFKRSEHWYYSLFQIYAALFSYETHETSLISGLSELRIHIASLSDGGVYQCSTAQNYDYVKYDNYDNYDYVKYDNTLNALHVIPVNPPYFPRSSTSIQLSVEDTRAVIEGDSRHRYIPEGQTILDTMTLSLQTILQWHSLATFQVCIRIMTDGTNLRTSSWYQLCLTKHKTKSGQTQCSVYLLLKSNYVPWWILEKF